MKTFRVGDIVTVTERQEAYYSNYGGLYFCSPRPAVALREGACIDFVKNDRKWRAGVDYGKVKLVKRSN